MSSGRRTRHRRHHRAGGGARRARCLGGEPPIPRPLANDVRYLRPAAHARPALPARRTRASARIPDKAEFFLTKRPRALHFEHSVKPTGPQSTRSRKLDVATVGQKVKTHRAQSPDAWGFSSPRSCLETPTLDNAKGIGTELRTSRVRATRCRPRARNPSALRDLEPGPCHAKAPSRLRACRTLSWPRPRPAPPCGRVLPRRRTDLLSPHAAPRGDQPRAAMSRHAIPQLSPADRRSLVPISSFSTR